MKNGCKKVSLLVAGAMRLTGSEGRATRNDVIANNRKARRRRTKLEKKTEKVKHV